MIASRTVGEDFTRRTEREHRAAIEAVVPPDELMLLGRQSLAGTAVTLGVLWLEIVALLAAANWIGLQADPLAILGTVVVVVLIATRINALGVVMHEASHGFLAPNRVLNDRICNVFAAWWMFHSVQEYRPAHRLHHRYLNQARDPDRISSQIAPTKHAMALLILQDLCGVSAVKKALILWSAAESDEGSTRNLGGLLGKVAAQLVLLGQFVIFQGLGPGRGVLCRLLALSLALHLLAHPAAQDDHRALRSAPLGSELPGLGRPNECHRLATESSARRADGVPLRAPHRADDPLPGVAAAAPSPRCLQLLLALRT